MTLTNRPIAEITGSDTTGTDLMAKLKRRKPFGVRYIPDIDPASEERVRACKMGSETRAAGRNWLIAQAELPDSVFDVIAGTPHPLKASRHVKAGIRAADLTQSAVCPSVRPTVETQHEAVIIDGGQHTLPIGSRDELAARATTGMVSV